MNRFKKAMANQAQRIIIERSLQALHGELEAMDHLKENHLLNLFNSGIVIDVTGVKKSALNLGINILEKHLKNTHKKR